MTLLSLRSFVFSVVLLSSFSIEPFAYAMGQKSAAASRDHHLAEVARTLGKESLSQYLAIQKHWVGTTQAACNYFVISALCQDGLCGPGIRDLSAGDFDSYLSHDGWSQTSLADVKQLFQSNADFDVIAQRDPGNSAHGHILIPVGVSPMNRLIVAEAELNGISHQVVEMTDGALLDFKGGMRFFISQ